jgi:hypothetical protein
MEMRNVYKILVGNPEGDKHLGDLDVDGRIALKRNLQEIMCLNVDGFIRFRGEHLNEP